jgi:glycosidase
VHCQFCPASCIRFLSFLIFCATLASCAGTGSPGASPPVSVTPVTDWRDAVIYFVLVDRFADGDRENNAQVDRRNPGGFHGGDLKGLTRQLDEITALGATAIWINPVVRQIERPQWAQGPAGSGWEQGFQHWGFHGYWAGDFERLEPHFGDEADLKAFVTAAHARGLKVLLDVVYNHVGYGARYLDDSATRHWFRPGEGDCGAEPLTCRVGGLPDFRTELPDVRDFLFRAHLGLAQRTGLDGFRLDAVKHVEHDFWQAHRARSRRDLGPGFFLLGEVWGGAYDVLDPWFRNDEMDAGFDFSFRGACQGFVDGKGRTVAYAAYLRKRHQVRSGYHLAHYLSSHDEPMFLHELAGDKQKFRLCVTLQMASLGIPVIYYGEEVARAGGAWPTNRADMPWGALPVAPGGGMARDDALRADYQRLIALRRAHPALSRGTFRELSSTGDLLVFAREETTSGDTVIVAVNRGTTAAVARVPLPAPWVGAPLREALSNAPILPEEGVVTIQTPPRTAQIFVSDLPARSATAWPASASRT